MANKDIRYLNKDFATFKEALIEYAKAQGIVDKDLLLGKMCPETCNILSHSKLKHRTCKCIF